MPRRRHPRNYERLPRESLLYSDLFARDSRRYFSILAGVSPEELAARENVKLSTVLASLERRRAFDLEHSSESLNVALRAAVKDRLPATSKAWQEGLEAQVEVKHTETDAEGKEITLYEKVPDHSTRLKMIASMTSLVEAIQPKSPAIVNNNSNSTSHVFDQRSIGLAPGAPISSEAIIRAVRAERGLAAPMELEETAHARLAGPRNLVSNIPAATTEPTHVSATATVEPPPPSLADMEEAEEDEQSALEEEGVDPDAGDEEDAEEDAEYKEEDDEEDNEVSEN